MYDTLVVIVRAIWMRMKNYSGEDDENDYIDDDDDDDEKQCLLLCLFLTQFTHFVIKHLTKEWNRI